jgi:hypothetical protein
MNPLILKAQKKEKRPAPGFKLKSTTPEIGHHPKK